MGWPALYLGVLLFFLVLIFLIDDGQGIDVLPFIFAFCWPVVLPIIGILVLAFGIAWVLRKVGGLISNRITHRNRAQQSNPG